MSGQRPSEEITLARIRNACMVNPVNEDLASFNIRNVANDMNGLGANIKIRGRNSDQICEDLMDFVPDVDAVCARGRTPKGKGAQNAVRAMVDHFNTMYHSNILTHDGQGKARPANELCADLYQQGDRILDNLTDAPTKVKEQLSNAIEQLVFQKEMLEQIFAKHLNGLSNSAGLDKLQNEMKLAKTSAASMIHKMERDIGVATEAYDGLVTEMEGQMVPMIRDAQEQFKALAARNYRGSDPQKIMIANDVINMGKVVGLAANKCSKCLNNFNIDITDFMDGDQFQHQAYRAVVKQRASDLLADGTVEKDYVRACEANLLSSRDECAKTAGLTSAFTYGYDERCNGFDLSTAEGKADWNSHGCNIVGSHYGMIDDDVNGLITSHADAVSHMADTYYNNGDNDQSIKSLLTQITGPSGLGSDSSSSSSSDNSNALTMFNMMGMMGGATSYYDSDDEDDY